MRVDQLMTRPVQTCGPQDPLARAAQLMWDHDCGCLPVSRADGKLQVVGVITDRDICMCALFHDQPLGNLLVSEAMAKQPIVCRQTDSIAAAEKLMRDARVRRLPVVDGEGALVGMISLADLAQEAARKRTAASQEVTEGEIGDTLAAISEPLHRQLAARARSSGRKTG